MTADEIRKILRDGLTKSLAIKDREEAIAGINSISVMAQIEIAAQLSELSTLIRSISTNTSQDEIKEYIRVINYEPANDL